MCAGTIWMRSGPPIGHIADAQLNIDKQIAIIDGFDWNVLFRSDEVP